MDLHSRRLPVFELALPKYIYKAEEKKKSNWNIRQACRQGTLNLDNPAHDFLSAAFMMVRK